MATLLVTERFLLFSGVFAALAWLALRWLRRPAPVPRQQAAAICYRRRTGKTAALEYLLVRTRNHRRWIYPKGRIEAGESADVAAAREAREEAGVRGRITGSLEAFEYGGESVAPWLLEVTGNSSTGTAERPYAWFERQAAKAALRENRSRKQAAGLIRVLSAAEDHLRAAEGSTARPG